MENQTNTPDSQKPKVKKTLKTLALVGVALIIIGIVLIVMSTTTAMSIIGFVLIYLGTVAILGGFIPKIERFKMQVREHIQEENKGTLTSIANTSADINSEAAGKVAKSMHNEISKQPAKFCKHCGAPVEPNQKFCSNCGNAL